MIRLLNYPMDKETIAEMFSTHPSADRETEKQVRRIIESVRKTGDRAVRRLTKQLEGIDLKPDQFEIPDERLREAWNSLPKDLQKALKTAHRRIGAYHKRQLVEGFTYRDSYGNRMEQRVTPLRRAGVYVPGGQAAYPSTVLMDVVPARIAGVDEVILLTPPALLNQPGGQAALGAAWLAGVDRVIAVSGTPGVAALALGTETIPQVDIIVGPGNRFIATAKRLLYGEIVIDMVAGPSEILVIADSSASPEVIAADMLSQAEHDPDAQAIVLLVGEYDIATLRKEIEKQTDASPRSDTVRQSLEANGALIQVGSSHEAVKLAEWKAPEHLEIMCRGGRHMANRIRNVGAIFLGRHTPEAVGDYVAGPNHTLPTGGTARFFSPLSVCSFLKSSHVVECSSKGLRALADDVITLAEAEGLHAHAEAVRKRVNRPGS